ncbi:hypothetical protein BC826DRAFT_489444 [Russula brevipes]|nr:hypothetical protein BC826DRAFT_489444 [Russula brevipes]
MSCLASGRSAYQRRPSIDQGPYSSRCSRAQVEWGAVGRLVDGAQLAIPFILCALHPLGLPQTRAVMSLPLCCPSFLQPSGIAFRFLRHTHTLHPPFFYLTIGYLPRHTTHSPLQAFSVCIASPRMCSIPTSPWMFCHAPSLCLALWTYIHAISKLNRTEFHVASFLVLN